MRRTLLYVNSYEHVYSTLGSGSSMDPIRGGGGICSSSSGHISGTGPVHGGSYSSFSSNISSLASSSLAGASSSGTGQSHGGSSSSSSVGTGDGGEVSYIPSDHGKVTFTSILNLFLSICIHMHIRMYMYTYSVYK
jgi:hypothetical protein